MFYNTNKKYICDIAIIHMMCNGVIEYKKKHYFTINDLDCSLDIWSC